MSWLGPAISAGSQVFGDLFGLFGDKPFGLTQGQHALDALQKAAIPQGMEATGRAQAYDQALLSGDPAAEAAAIAPAVNASAATAEQAKKQVSSEGTARGGGVNAALQASADLPTKTAVDTITALQPGAAANLTNLGAGLTATGVGAAGTEAGIASGTRGQNTSFLDSILSRMKPGGGDGTTPTDTSGGGGGGTPADFSGFSYDPGGGGGGGADFSGFTYDTGGGGDE
jgi:hypothetical protein